MDVARRARVPLILALLTAAAAVGLTRPQGLHAADPPWDPPPCPPGGQGPAVGHVGAWFSLQPELDVTGTLTGQRLTLGKVETAAAHRIDLPAESFASGPVGDRVLVGDDDGTRSRLRLIDIAAGCATEIGREPSVVRGAILSRDGTVAWEHRVGRTDRQDLGIWWRPIAGGPARAVLPGLPADPRYGPTFATTLGWADDGRLAVASCGERACRIRVLDPAGGHVDRVDGTGPLVGVAGSEAVTYDVCPGLPCPILAVDLGSGTRTELVAAGGIAVLAGQRGRTLVQGTSSGALTLLDLDTGASRIVAGTGSVWPVRRDSGASSGVEIADGAALVAPGGQLTNPTVARQIDVAAGRVTILGEVLR